MHFFSKSVAISWGGGRGRSGREVFEREWEWGEFVAIVFSEERGRGGICSFFGLCIIFSPFSPFLLFFSFPSTH